MLLALVFGVKDNMKEFSEAALKIAKNACLSKVASPFNLIQTDVKQQCFDMINKGKVAGFKPLFDAILKNDF